MTGWWVDGLVVVFVMAYHRGLEGDIGCHCEMRWGGDIKARLSIDVVEFAGE